MTKIISRILLIIVSCLLFQPISAQKVGLVLSGGGAKGCTHIGIIRALEENEIPIDYVAGTSMGAIISSLYAIGYSSQDMEELLESDLFKAWIKGDVDDDNRFYFKAEEETPEFIFFKLTYQDSLSFKPAIPSSVVLPDQMNQALLYLYAQSTTQCGGNFDSLFVPFRCIASDIKDKKAYIHRSGDLGDAVRTSMSFPFVFKPIRVNDHLMVDGGLYNNYPVDVMRDDFKADYIIGSNVGDDSNANANSENPLALVERLIINRSEDSVRSSEGVQMTFRYTDVGLLDFHKAQELIKIGYDSTMAHMDEIKANVARRVSQDSVNHRRELFAQKKPELLFKNIIIRGVNPLQQRFLAKSFHDDDEYFDFDSFKRTYFKLLSDKKIAEIIPHARFNPETNAYDLILDVELNDHFKFGFGGNISSTVSNQLFISAKYLGIQRLGWDVTLDGQVGRLYDNLHLQTRLDFPSRYPFCLKIIGDLNRFSYSSDKKMFYDNESYAKAISSEMFFKTKISIPVILKGQMDASFGYGRTRNKFHGFYTVSEDEYDVSNYNTGVAMLQFNHYNLSHKQYPVSGTQARIGAQYIRYKKYQRCFSPIEDTIVNNKPVNDYEKIDKQSRNQWFKITGLYDHYFNAGKHFSLGVMAEGVYSNHGLEDNYMETLLTAPAFTPTKHSMMVFNSAFRANTFIAGGLKPIFKLNDIVHFRWENYIFVPHKQISPTSHFAPSYDKAFSHLYYLSELTAVAHLKFIAIGIYGNYYSYPEKNWNVGLNIGYLIFHERLIER